MNITSLTFDRAQLAYDHADDMPPDDDYDEIEREADKGDMLRDLELRD